MCIRDRDRIAVQEKHIGRFDVAVDHGGGMDRVDGGRQTDRDPVQVLGREWAVAVDDVIERRPGQDVYKRQGWGRCR